MAFAPGSLSNDAAAWKGQSLVGVQQLDEAGLNLVLTHAERLRGQPRDKVSARQRGKILANVFYEPSTRGSGCRMAQVAFAVRISAASTT